MNEPILHSAAQALREVAGEVVLVGGSAFRLFGQHAMAGPLLDPLLSTEDIDIAVPARGQATPIRDHRILDALKQHDFEADTPSSIAGKRTYGYLGKTEQASYLQFITPRGAPGREGRHERDYGGLELNELEGVRLLLQYPWELGLDGNAGTIRIVCPAAFLVQKFFVLDSRHGLDKRAKDLVYVFSTLKLFAEALPTLTESASRLDLKPRELKRLAENRTRFAGANSEDMLRAAKILASVSTPVPPDMMAATIRVGMDRLLGTQGS